MFFEVTNLFFLGIKLFYEKILIFLGKIKIIEINFKRGNKFKDKNIKGKKYLLIRSTSFYPIIKKIISKKDINKIKIYFSISCDHGPNGPNKYNEVYTTKINKYIKNNLSYFYESSKKQISEDFLNYSFQVNEKNEDELYKLFNLNFFEKIYELSFITNLVLYMHEENKKILEIRYLPENKTIKILYFK
ncbi:MAG: hypothetical protein QXY29_01290 [Candidatus Aenigmatarchaeota archaeon]